MGAGRLKHYKVVCIPRAKEDKLLLRLPLWDNIAVRGGSLNILAERIPPVEHPGRLMFESPVNHDSNNGRLS